MSDPMIRPTRRRLLALGGAALLWPRAGRAEPLETVSGRAFGTEWHLAAPSGSDMARLRPAIEAVLDEVDRQMSPWRADSEIGRFNAGRAGEHGVSAATAHVTAEALRLTARSNGAFDPTVGPLVARWGFGPIRGDGPDPSGITVQNGVITKRAPGLTLDLCGIAKGWALDRVTDLARDAGHDSLLFDLGGELAALGRHPSGRAWHVAVEDPTGTPDAPAVMRLSNGQAVATSGLRTQSYAAGARPYGHIIDPTQAAPASSALLSVTVTAASAMEADGWATALFAAGAEAGPALARDHELSALFLLAGPDGLRQHRTGAISEALL